jgi:predicted transcriptional regulator of viral defense system
MINKILKIMKKNNEIITPAQLEKKGISRVYLSRMEEEGIIERIERGIYVTKDYEYDEYYLFQLKYPKTVFSYNTALYFYEMTERTPIKMDVSISKNYNPHRFKDIVNVYRINDELFDLGIVEKKSPQGMKVRTYNLERTICDIIKDKDSIDIEIRNKAIKKAIKSKEFNASKMFEYAKKMNIYDKVKNYMEAII